MKYLIIGSLLLLSSCMSVEKAEKVMRANPVELAKLCADCFPVKKSEVIKGDIVYLPSDTVYVESVEVVEVIADCPDGTKVKTKCPPCKDKIIHIPSLRVDTVEVRDTAFEEVLKNERDDYNNKYSNMEQLRDGWRKWCLVLGGVLLLLCIGLFLKFYLRL